MHVSAFEPRSLRKSSRLTKFSCAGSMVSAETSYGLPRMVALAPRTSPGSAILTISVFPSVDDVVSFARPLQRMKMPRGISPSTNRSDPLGYTPVNLTASSDAIELADMLQKIRSALTLHSVQVLWMSRL